MHSISKQDFFEAINCMKIYVMFKYHSKSLRCQKHSNDDQRCPLHMPKSHRFVSIPMFHGMGSWKVSAKFRGIKCDIDVAMS